MNAARNLKSVSFIAMFTLLAVLAVSHADGQTAKPSVPAVQPEAARRKELERDAAINLSLVKKSIQDDAFFNAKVALNVWKLSATEAGNFDKKLYDDLRKQLYDKSIRDNLRCIDVAIAQRDSSEANLCLKIYRLHSQEIGVFDPQRYDDLKIRIGGIRKKGK
jgi:hypothetical protein